MDSAKWMSVLNSFYNLRRQSQRGKSHRSGLVLSSSRGRQEQSDRCCPVFSPGEGGGQVEDCDKGVNLMVDGDGDGL